MAQNVNQNDTLVWRIKTEEEFIEDYGENWHQEYCPYFLPQEPDMKQLLGACISEDCFIKGEGNFKNFTSSVNPSFYLILKKGVLNNNEEWKIAKWMITDKPFTSNKKSFSKSKFAKGDVIHVVKSFRAVTGEEILKGFQGLVENVEHLKEGEGWDKVNFYRYELSFMIGRKTVKAFAYEDEIKLPAVIYQGKDMINKLNSPEIKKEESIKKISDQAKEIAFYKGRKDLEFIPEKIEPFFLDKRIDEIEIISVEDKFVFAKVKYLTYSSYLNGKEPLFTSSSFMKDVFRVKSTNKTTNKNQSNNSKTDAHGTDKQKTDKQSLVSRPHRSKITERTVERGTGLKSNRIQSKLGSNDRYNEERPCDC